MPHKRKKTTLIKIEKVLESVRQGSSIEIACKKVEMHRSTFYEWLQEDRANIDRYEKLIDSRSLVVEDALFKNALQGNTTAQIFWLKNRVPQRWHDVSDHRVNHRSDDRSMSPNNKYDLSVLTSEELLELRRIQEKIQLIDQSK